MVHFYTELLGLKISDRYGDDLVPGGMVFMHCGTDHHGLALVGGAAPGPRQELNHFAWEVATIEEVFAAREFLRERAVAIDFEGRRRAGSQIAIEFLDPEGNHVEIYWGIDQIGTNGLARPSGEWRQAFSLEEAVATPVPGQNLGRQQQGAEE